MTKLFTSEIQDEYIRENFKRLNDWFQVSDLFQGFVHAELVFPGAAQSFEHTHRLGFVPTDVVQTFVSNGATVSWNYDLFSREKVVLSVDKACTVRFFIGRYRGQS